MDRKQHSLFFFVIVLSTFYFSTLSGQNQSPEFDRYRVKDGLPSNDIKEILQDEQGFIWMTTIKNGVSRFDGYSFQNFGFDHQDVTEGSLQVGAYVNGLVLGKDGKVWFGAEWSGAEVNGAILAVYDPVKEAFKNYFWTEEDSLGLNLKSAEPLFEDATGNLWCINSDDQNTILCRLDQAKGTFQKFKIDEVYNPKVSSYRAKQNRVVGNCFLVESQKDNSIWLVDNDSQLNKWDSELQNFALVDGISGIADSIISIYPTRTGDILLQGPSIIHLFDPLTLSIEKTIAYKANEFKSLASSNEIYYVFEDAYGDIWIRYMKNNKMDVYHIATDSMSHYELGVGDLDFQYEGRYMNWEILDQDSFGIWFLVDIKEAIYYDFKTRQFSFYPDGFNNRVGPLIRERLKAMMLDRTGLFWLGTIDGIYKQDLKLNRMQWYQYAKNNSDAYNIANMILNLVNDQKGRLWLESSSGLGLYDTKSNLWTIFEPNGPSLDNEFKNFIFSVFVDSKNQIWTGTKLGLHLFDETDSSFTNILEKNQAYKASSANLILDIYEDSQAQLWIGSLQNIFVINIDSKEVINQWTINEVFKNQKTIPTASPKIIEDKSGDIWITHANGIIARYDKEEGTFDVLSVEKSTSIPFLDNNGDLWISGKGEYGLLKYDDANDKFLKFAKNINSGHYFVTDSILYLTTEEHGLLEFNLNTYEEKYYRKKDGLIDNYFLTQTPLVKDKNDRLYIPAELGLSVFDLKDKTFTNFGNEYNFQTNGEPFSSVKSTDGTVWIGGGNGLNRIDPDQLFQKNIISPQVWITSIGIMDTTYSQPDGELFEKAVSFTRELTLKHWQRDLTFNFVGLHYLDPKLNQYSWKLENYDQEFSNPSTVRFANYTNLSPGTYTFRVKASNADGVWNEEGASIKIIILPPWWQTTWAYLAYILLAGLGIWAFIQWRTKNLRKQSSLLKAQVEERTHELKLSNEQLLIAKKEAEDANEAKSTFLSTVSHELRTPLTSVLGFAKIIRKRFNNKIIPALPTEDPKLTRTMDQINGNLDVVISEGERLTRLINDVLDLAKIEAGKIEWHFEEVEITQIVQQARAATASLFDAKKLEYTEDIAGDIPIIITDRNKMVQVLINLLSNAVKFTEEGTVGVKAIVEGAYVVVSVTDTGIGIADNDLHKVFDKFRQVGDTLTDKPQGTGLGLPICKEIVEQQNGRIWVNSELGQGSTFSFSLPIKKAASKSEESLHLEALIDELKKKVPITAAISPERNHQNILVVDDEASIRELLRQELSEIGYQVSLAEDGKKALKMIRDQRPDMVILDVMMPELNGFDLAAILKNDPKTADIPILILSIVQDKQRGYRIGVDRYLNKPIDTDLLFKEVESLLSTGISTKKVMIVDESASTVKTISEVLTARGYQVMEADGDDMLEKAKSALPDVIILNSLMDGREEMVKTLRFEKGLENVLFLLYQ
ncbi:MAG: response regulator [Bacteroidota bacterium]